MLNYEYPPLGGGAAPVSKEIAEQLVSRGHNVDVVTTHFKGLKGQEIINGVSVYRLKCARKHKATCNTLEMLSYVKKAIPFTLKLTKREKYDVLHSHFIVPTSIVAYVLKKRRNLDYVITVHGSDVPGYNPDRFTWEHKFTKPLLKLLMGDAKAITVPSSYLKKLMIKNITSKCKIAVIPNGIDVSKIKPLKKEKWILMTGRLLPRKGFQYALSALSELNLKNWKIHIAGDGPYREELEKLAKKVKTKVNFHGWLSNDSKKLKELYGKSSIYCLPSSHENSSVALLEAMLSEMAVITTNVTGCPETVGKSGFLVKVADTKQLASIFQKLTKNPKLTQKKGKEARKRVLENFEWSKLIKEYEKTLSRGK